jgi:uncharacterized phiE125 gp8 family phage protein
MLKPVLVTPPAVKPVSLDEVKRNCNIDHGDDDALIDGYIDAAVALLDGYGGTVGQALVNQSWAVSMPGFCGRMRLPVGPLVSVTSIQYYNSSNVQATASSALYAAHSDALGPYITLKSGQSWPTVYGRDDAVTVTWVAGHGAAAADVPASIRQAMLLLVGHWYQNREAVNIGNITSALPFSVDALLGPRRRIGV